MAVIENLSLASSRWLPLGSHEVHLCDSATSYQACDTDNGDSRKRPPSQCGARAQEENGIAVALPTSVRSPVFSLPDSY